VLVLSRKCEQSLLLGDDITITVLAIDGERVKLGIEAPRSVPVLRSEVFEQMQIANSGAAHPPQSPTVHAIVEAMRHRAQAESDGVLDVQQNPIQVRMAKP
jgi:carbon storage regulator